jgi:hypothetical protein
LKIKYFGKFLTLIANHSFFNNINENSQLKNMKRNYIFENLLLKIDGTISLLFGILTILFQIQIYSTAVDLSNIQEKGNSLIESALQTISIFYILIGLTCLLFSFTNNDSIDNNKMILKLKFLMFLKHLIFLYKNFVEKDRSWYIGNPYYDIIIHLLFLIFYIFSMIKDYIKIDFKKNFLKS